MVRKINKAVAVVGNDALKQGAWRVQRRSSRGVTIAALGKVRAWSLPAFRYQRPAGRCV